MKRIQYPEELTALVEQLRRLPGIGPRSAERMALWLVRGAETLSQEIGEAILRSRETLGHCERCGFFVSSHGSCQSCGVGHGRDSAVLCVVEQPADVVAIEKSGAFGGIYHCLGGRIAPLDHIGPEELRVEPLLRRLEEEGVQEVILALSNDVEGEATANYLREILGSRGVRISRPAQGLPAGGGLETTDEVTLGRAMTARTVF